MKCKLCKKPIRQLQGRKRTRCNSCNTKIRRYRTKKAAVELLGGACEDCGFTEGLAAFEFHHECGKDFILGSAANKSWEVVRKELKKCILLCSNCHRERHSDYSNPALVEEAKNYKGRVLD